MDLFISSIRVIENESNMVRQQIILTQDIIVKENKREAVVIYWKVTRYSYTTQVELQMDL